MYPKINKLIFIILFNLLIINIVNAQNCAGGMAGDYPCANIDLRSYVSSAALDLGNGNDIWGWTSAASGREYALVGTTQGTVFVDVTDADDAWIIGKIAFANGSSGSQWRDIKVNGHYAYIGSEAPDSGIQVFDLNQLEAITTPPTNPFIFEEEDDMTSDFITKSHNLVINEETDLLIAVGSNKCRGGLVFYDLSTKPSDPPNAGCFSDDGYSHDAVCFVYRGPDVEHVGKEICIGFNTNTYTTIDVTDRDNPIQISRETYINEGYTHQGWITDDHRYLIVNDELDERFFGLNARTLVFDISDLDNPVDHTIFNHNYTSPDHNLYIRGSYVYQANYRAGLRILDISDLKNKNITEAAHFDVYPADDNNEFNGAWSVYPYFNSNKVIINGIEQGLFVVEPKLDHFVIEKTDTGVKMASPGETIVYNLNLIGLGNFDGDISIDATGFPAGSTFSFNNTSVTKKSITPTTFSVNLPTDAAVGNYSILLTATAPNAPTQNLALGLQVQAALAIESLAFTAQAAGIANILQWEISSRKQVEQFEIQRSTNGVNDWQVAGQVSANIDDELSRYEWKDTQPLQQSFYRMVITDKAGNQNVSTIINVERQAEKEQVTLYPNPVKSTLEIRYSSNSNRKDNLQIINVLGEVVQQVNWEVSTGLNYKEIEVKNLLSGVYFLTQNGKMLQRFVKQ